MKHRQHHHRIAAGFVTLSGLAMGLVLAVGYTVPEANANDDKVFAPQFCVPLEDSNNTFDASDAEFHNNRIESGDDKQRIICPLMRDIIKGKLDTVWVRLDNVEKDKEETECCVIAWDPLGEDSEEECEEADESEGLQTIEIDGPDAEDNGYYVVTCDLQEEGESIRSIRTSEADTDK